MADDVRSSDPPNPPEPDEELFFRADPPPETAPEAYHLAPNPEFDRSDSNRQAGIDEGAPFFTTGITGVREGYENAMRLLVMSTNAMSETDIERRFAAIKTALDFMESVKDDPNAADTIDSEKGRLLGSIAAALMSRRIGDPAQNRQTAIEYYQRAMQHFVDHQEHKDILKTKYNLADAYAAGIGSDDRSDGRLALTYLREVIDEASPSDVTIGVAARLNFASLARRLSKHDGGETLIEGAIGYAKEAAAAVSKKANMAFWSSAMNTLGGLYADRQRGDRRSNLREAIRCFEESLTGRPRDTVPDAWSVTMQNLMAVKREYVRDFEPDNIGKSDREYIAFREQRVADLTSRGRPLLAAGAKVDLARELLGTRGAAEREVVRARDLIESACATFEERNAVEDLVKALQLLYVVGLRLKRYDTAAFHGWKALFLSETLEDGGVELERVREISESLKGLDARVALLFLSMGETAAALDALERGRARFLRSSMRLSSAATDQRTVIARARARVIALEREIAALKEPPRDVVEAFIEARENLAKLEEQVSRSPSPEEDANLFRRTWHVVERLMHTYDGIVVPIFDGSRCAIVVLAMDNGELRASVVFSERDLRPISGRWKATSWTDAAARKMAIDVAGAELWETFGHLAASGLVRRKVAFGARVAIVPQGQFGDLPLALAREPREGIFLCDMFELSFAPSIMALDRRTSEPESPTLAAIVNPTQDLPLSAIEALNCGAVFGQDRAAHLFGAECTKAATLAGLRARSHWLLSAHGDFDETDARKAGLQLSNGEWLTFDDLLTLVDLEPPRLVILSACDTGVHAVERAAEEFVGLPVGFLQLGAGGVLATLWPVSDVSTALVISAFMTSHIARHTRPARALHEAQRWVREATAEQVRQLIASLVSGGVPPDTHKALQSFDRMLADADPSARLFEHPYHWGGFILYGA